MIFSAQATVALECPPRPRLPRVIVRLSVLLGIAGTLAAADAQPALDNPGLWKMSRETSVVETGRTVFNTSCVVCHLPSLRGKSELATAVGSDLTDAIWENGGSPLEIHKTVTHGLPDRGMVAWGPLLEPDKITAVVAYVLSKHREDKPILAEPGAVQPNWLAGNDTVPFPDAGAPPLVAQMPVELPAGYVMEGLCVAYPNRDLILYDLEVGELQSVWTDAKILRSRVTGRSFTLAGVESTRGFPSDNPLALMAAGNRQAPTAFAFSGYTRLADGVEVRRTVVFGGASVEMTETLRLLGSGSSRRLERGLAYARLPAGSVLEFSSRRPVGQGDEAPRLFPVAGQVSGEWRDKTWEIRFSPDPQTHEAKATLIYPLPSSAKTVAGAGANGTSAPALAPHVRADPLARGSLTRPGYRAVSYPLPRLASGEDRVMPSALAVDPKTGQLFVASLKLGEVFALRDAQGGANSARWDNFGAGLFQDVFALSHDGQSLLVMHRQKLTRLTDTDGDGRADRFEQVAALPQSPDPGAYDLAYGLVPDKTGAFVVSFAPYASREIVGSGGAARLVPGERGLALKEVAFGLRNPVGWSTGPKGEIFFTDNQGEWVAASRFSHLVPGRYYGFPNPQQPQHVKKPMGPATVWVPNGWAKSINGVTYDSTEGKFGPFAGQFFLAELMQGGALIRAQIEEVNGQYQGACFPFWHRGLLGPLVLSFDPQGHLWVGSITEPSWMRQSDRGALYRIDFTGEVPFEIESLHVRPQGFQLKYTRPPNRRARDAISYRVEHYRYELWKTYGSPEMELTPVAVQSVVLQPDGRTVELQLPALVKGRIYRFVVDVGVNSVEGEPLVNAQAAYTLNEIPTR